MSNSYLKGKIKRYELYKEIIVGVLVIFAYFVGRNFFFNGPLNLIVGLALGVVGAVALLVVEYYIRKQAPYKKGLKLEEQIADKLENLDFKYEPHVKTDYGDLDFFIEKGGICYGFEAKNQSGNVTFENGLFKIDGWSNNDVLIALLKHCKLVRDKKFGENSGKFIKPILVFGYKAIVSIPQNKIMFNNIEIIVATIKDFERFI